MRFILRSLRAILVNEFWHHQELYWVPGVLLQAEDMGDAPKWPSKTGTHMIQINRGL